MTEPRRILGAKLCGAVLLFSLALVLRLQFQSQVEYTPYEDAVAYHEVGWRLVTDREYAEPPWRAFRPPGYAFFLAGVYSLSGPDPEAAQVVQAVLDSLACIALAVLAWSMYGRVAGVLAGLFAAFHKVLIEVTGELLSESLFTPLSVFFLFCVWAPRIRASFLWPVCAGCIASVLFVTRSQLSVALPGLLMWAWWAWRDAWPSPRRRSIALILLLTFTMILPTAWRQRNSRLFDGAYSGLATISWPNLYWGNIGINELWELDRQYRPLPWPEGELGFANHAKEELVGRIQSDPVAYATFVVQRLRRNIPRYFAYKELYETHRWFGYSPPVALDVRHLGVFVLLGGVACWRRLEAGTFLMLYAVPQMALYLLLSNAGHRFSWAMTVIYCILAAVGVQLIIDLVRNVRASPAPSEPATKADAESR